MVHLLFSQTNLVLLHGVVIRLISTDGDLDHREMIRKRSENDQTKLYTNWSDEQHHIGCENVNHLKTPTTVGKEKSDFLAT